MFCHGLPTLQTQNLTTSFHIYLGEITYKSNNLTMTFLTRVMLTSALRALVKNYLNVIVLMVSHKNLCNEMACVSLLRRKQMF